jgi:hypothetical protein
MPSLFVVLKYLRFVTLLNKTLKVLHQGFNSQYFFMCKRLALSFLLIQTHDSQVPKANQSRQDVVYRIIEINGFNQHLIARSETLCSNDRQMGISRCYTNKQNLTTDK